MRRQRSTLAQLADDAPAGQSVTLRSGQTNWLSVAYRPMAGAKLKVDLDPFATLYGARWFLIEEPTNTWVSGQTIERAPCNYTVDFVLLEGFFKPAPIPVTLVYGRTNAISASYTALRLWLTMRDGLFVSGPSGVICRVQTKADLLGTSAWSNLMTITLTNGVSVIPETIPVQTGSRFYRAAQAP